MVKYKFIESLYVARAWVLAFVYVCFIAALSPLLISVMHHFLAPDGFSEWSIGLSLMQMFLFSSGMIALWAVGFAKKLNYSVDISETEIHIRILDKITKFPVSSLKGYRIIQEKYYFELFYDDYHEKKSVIINIRLRRFIDFGRTLDKILYENKSAPNSASSR